MRYLSVTLLLLLGFLVVTVATADDDHEQARRLKESGHILPLQQIIKRVQTEQSGRVIEVELENEDGRYVYEVELLDEHGEVWELYLDATTGELIKRKRDD